MTTRLAPRLLNYRDDVASTDRYDRNQDEKYRNNLARSNNNSVDQKQLRRKKITKRVTHIEELIEEDQVLDQTSIANDDSIIVGQDQYAGSNSALDNRYVADNYRRYDDDCSKNRQKCRRYDVGNDKVCTDSGNSNCNGPRNYPRCQKYQGCNRPYYPSFTPKDAVRTYQSGHQYLPRY